MSKETSNSQQAELLAKLANDEGVELFTLSPDQLHKLAVRARGQLANKTEMQKMIEDIASSDAKFDSFMKDLDEEIKANKGISMRQKLEKASK